MSSINGPEYGAVRRCVAELEEMWLSVPDARDAAAEVPALDPTLSGLTDPGTFLSHPWEQGPAAQRLGAGGPLAVADMRRWLEGMLRSAEAERGHAEALYERWARDPEWLAVDTFGEPRAVLQERLEQTVAGLALTIGDERLEGEAGALFRINWQPDSDGLGCWEGAPAAAAFSLREAAEDNAELLGEFPYALVAPVAGLLLRDLRRGQLVLPLLPRSERSTPGTTWLRWAGPGAADERGLLLAEAPAQASPEDPEDVLRRFVPELACLYEQALALASRGLDDTEPMVVDPRDTPTPLDNGRAPFAGQLVAQLRRLTGLPAETLVRFLTVPLEIIVRFSVRKFVQRRAQFLLDALRDSLN
jgi:hypothetical protein